MQIGSVFEIEQIKGASVLPTASAPEQEPESEPEPEPEPEPPVLQGAINLLLEEQPVSVSDPA